ncbi:anti-sigma-28 factor, FlgM family [Noviherbaspirillum humi]|uniref:Negative regulator of flagellin synthesis n=1 Tax=Noviherbaspirillum humi TaxID=1688639 RepID=A0A239FVF6_9BURK|nr:flagellar biosynthesis anti-sigma factor FlgM [Noviherbaspirillum humi]SNS60861.1 anti-sigma-28 factor, FlgM family [Noviherbaspirillum humi]
MKIDDSIKKAAGLPVGAAGTAQARSARGADKTGAVSNIPASKENVSLSEEAKALSGNSGVFDAAKVEQIKAAIADGTFKVDPEKIANGLLDSAADLVRASRK